MTKIKKKKKKQPPKSSKSQIKILQDYRKETADKVDLLSESIDSTADVIDDSLDDLLGRRTRTGGAKSSSLLLKGKEGRGIGTLLKFAD